MQNKISMGENDESPHNFLEANKLIPVAIVGDHLMGVGPKTDEGFKENMQRVAAAHPNSPLADKFGGSTESHAEIKN